MNTVFGGFALKIVRDTAQPRERPALICSWAVLFNYTI